jgi:hypothetical protein
MIFRNFTTGVFRRTARRWPLLNGKWSDEELRIRLVSLNGDAGKMAGDQGLAGLGVPGLGG